jgi:cyclophilin family peptidyl-prolyl cis-trans isomerase
MKCILLLVVSQILIACNQPTTTTPSVATAQDLQVRERKPVEEASAMDFADLKAQWQDLNTRLRAIRTTLSSGDAANARELQQEFKEKGELAIETVLPRLKQAGMKAFVASGAKPEEIEPVLVEVADVLRSLDRYEESLEVCRMLIDAGSSQKDIYDIAAFSAFGSDQFDEAAKYLKLAQEKGALNRSFAIAESIPLYQKLWIKESELRKAEAAADDLPRVKLETTAGNLVIELFENEAPETVANFISLVDKGFYDGLIFHRVLPGFMAQGGDPTGTGAGGPGYQIFCECEKQSARMHFSGTLSMAHAGQHTGGSQFFLTFLPTPHLNGKHTAFGRVIEGKDILPRLLRVEPASGGETDKIIRATVVRKRDHEYTPRKSS